MGERGGWSHPEELTEVSHSWDKIILNTSNLFTNVLTLRTLKTKPIIIIKSPKSKGGKNVRRLGCKLFYFAASSYQMLICSPKANLCTHCFLHLPSLLLHPQD